MQIEAISALVVDGAEEAQRQVVGSFDAIGIKDVRVAAGYRAAVKEVAKRMPHVVLVEWSRQEFGGLEFLRFIRRSAGSPDVTLPVVAMAADAGQGEVFRARDAGANGFLLKPVAPLDLDRVVQAVIFNPRPFVRAASYVGPCRRRKNNGLFYGDGNKRVSDLAQPPAALREELRKIRRAQPEDRPLDRFLVEFLDEEDEVTLRPPEA